ncbi:MAG TPA: hypothetical protein VFA65_07835 [Bryobacteraceae bacterium]|nr:hypothetical protein [Bryobacteraceae bacterium]
MATLSTARPSLATRTEALSTATTARIPWYIWCAALAGTSLLIGAHWDISWHSSIGRDTFWTPAHMAIYMCGVLAGVSFGYVILHTTFSRNSRLAAGSVHIWGFRAPLGAFIAAWGGITMLISAPFDNWWHDAYGLDVKIVSPPHILLFIGGCSVLLGTMVLIAGEMNRESESRRAPFLRLFLYMCGLLLVNTMIVLMEYTDRTALHLSLPYILVCSFTPIILAIGSRATGARFAATSIAGIYTLFIIGLILVLPLFPAQPKLGPVYQNVTQFIPPEFPLLIIVPAFLLDLFWSKSRNWNPWAIAAISAAIYVAVLVAIEWPFASFLMSPASRNRFFGTMYLWYGMPPTSFLARNEFFPSPGAERFAFGMLFAFLASILAIRWGWSRGNWFKQIKR